MRSRAKAPISEQLYQTHPPNITLAICHCGFARLATLQQTAKVMIQPFTLYAHTIRLINPS